MLLLLACAPAPSGWDLAQPEVLLGLIDEGLGLRRLREPLAFGLSAAGAACPTAAGDALELPTGARSWLGTCSTPEGGVYSGRLDLVWARDDARGAWEERWDGQDWRVEGGEVEHLGLGGRWEAAGGVEEDTRWLEEQAVGSLRLILPGAAPLLPDGAAGRWALSASWGPLEDVHAVEAELEAPGLGPLGLSLRMVQSAGGCASGLPDAGSFALWTSTQRAELDLGSPGACVGCWDWTLDGQPQAEPVCR